MKKVLISCSLGLGILMGIMSQNAQAFTVERYGHAMLKVHNTGADIQCGNPTPAVCYRLHFENNYLKRMEVFFGTLSHTIQTPPGTTLNGIPAETIQTNVDLGPSVEVVLPNQD